MKKQFLNILFAFAFCLGSSNVVLSMRVEDQPEKQPASPTEKATEFSKYFEITGRHLHDNAMRLLDSAHKNLLKRINKNSANGAEEGTESEEKAVKPTENDQQPEENNNEEANTWFKDIKEHFSRRKAYALEQAQLKLDQAKAKATETATETADQAKINLASAFTSLVSKVPGGVSGGYDIVTRKCTDFMKRITDAWELRKTLNILIGKVKAKDFTEFSNEEKELKAKYDSLPVDKKAKVLNAWLEQREKISNQKLKADIKEATQADKASKATLKKNIANTENSPAGIQEATAGVGTTMTLDQRIESLKEVSKTSLRTDIKDMAQSLQPELKSGQIVTPVESTDATTGKVVSIRFDVIDLNDINLTEPLVGKKITNPDGKESYENSTHRNLLAMQGKLNMNSKSLENVVSQYFADKVDLAKMKVDDVKSRLDQNILIPEFNGTKFSDFSSQLKADILSKVMEKADAATKKPAETQRPATVKSATQVVSLGNNDYSLPSTGESNLFPNVFDNTATASSTPASNSQVPNNERDEAFQKELAERKQQRLDKKNADTLEDAATKARFEKQEAEKKAALAREATAANDRLLREEEQVELTRKQMGATNSGGDDLFGHIKDNPGALKPVAAKNTFGKGVNVRIMGKATAVITPFNRK